MIGTQLRLRPFFCFGSLRGAFFLLHKFCTCLARKMPCRFIVKNIEKCDNFVEVIDMSNVMYPGFQQPMYQPTFPTQLPQMQRSPMQLQQQPIMQPQPMAQGVLTMVTSKEQAVVAQIPFDGLPYFFYNTAADEIYSKRFDPATGQSPLVPYKREQPAAEIEWAPMALVQQMAQQMQAMQDQLMAMQPRAKRASNKEEETT